jgi:phosphosulfolactate synthase (CoM biosynthesis protein A)
MDSIDRSMDFLRMNPRPPKPRRSGVTEIRGPYYTPIGTRYLTDLFETAGAYVDSFKFGGGSFAIMPAEAVKGLIDLCHQHDVTVSTGGFIEYVLTQGPQAVDRYLERCKELGFDTVEISSGFITIPPTGTLKLIDKVHAAGMKAKVEVGIQFGAGGASTEEALKSEGTRDVASVVAQAKRFVAEGGADAVMLESEGITESVARERWRTDVPGRFADALGLEILMFEAADPEVFSWYVQTFGPDVNLFVDHSQIVQLECLRAGIWGTSATWGRIISY